MELVPEDLLEFKIRFVPSSSASRLHGVVYSSGFDMAVSKRLHSMNVAFKLSLFSQGEVDRGNLHPIAYGGLTPAINILE